MCAPGDGPEEFHLVLLDNGRTDVLADEVAQKLARLQRGPLTLLGQRAPGLAGWTQARLARGPGAQLPRLVALAMSATRDVAWRRAGTPHEVAGAPDEAAAIAQRSA